MEEFEAMLDKLGNMICERIPEGYILTLNFQRGSGWVDMMGPDYNDFILDGTDKSLAEQIGEALNLAENPQVNKRE